MKPFFVRLMRSFDFILLFQAVRLLLCVWTLQSACCVRAMKTAPSCCTTSAARVACRVSARTRTSVGRLGSPWTPCICFPARTTGRSSLLIYTVGCHVVWCPQLCLCFAKTFVGINNFEGLRFCLFSGYLNFAFEKKYFLEVAM